VVINDRWSMTLVLVTTILFASSALGDEPRGGENLDLPGLLAAAEPWLFVGDRCPSEVFPGTAVPIEYRGDCSSDPKRCLSECFSQNGSACYTLATRLQQLEIDVRYPKALFLRACRLGISSGCTNAAAGSFSPDAPETWPCAAASFGKACEASDAWGCTMYGFCLSRGLGVEQNLEQATAVLTQVCRPEDGDPACRQARAILDEIRAAQGE